jgi:uncharacterized protein (DUF362 family)/Pyruvate/2-oxoacid:ferredoxin oxidoreductase delta subunit
MSQLELHSFDQGRVARHPAWTTSEIDAAVETLLETFEDRLPTRRDVRVVVKPNLNNDLVALTGNCVDLRVLGALLAALRRRGFHDLTVADGSNVGVERRDINTFKRLRVDRMADRHGARIVDLNHDEGARVVLTAGAHPHVARTILDADFLISVPKIKTHVEAGLSCAMKNWVGIARGQDKRQMHYDLPRNIFAINEVIQPDLVLVDGLVGMEGNGPGDGEPFRFGQLLMSDYAPVNDVVVCRLVDLPVSAVPYLGHALEAGLIDQALVECVSREVPVLRPIKRAPPRRRLAELADRREIFWLKRAVRPLTDRPEVAKAAYKLKIIQDVYSLEDDTVTRIARAPSACGDCQKCADFCPTGLTADEIGVKTDPADCIGCLYCWWVCPKDAITLDGELHGMQRQVDRYKAQIEQL